MEVYGYYQMVEALAMSLKGKVKTGSKQNNNKLLKNPQKQVGYDSDLGQEALEFRNKGKKIR